MRTIKFVFAVAALIVAGVACTAAAEGSAPAKVEQSVAAGAPQACLDALDKAETVMKHARTGLDYSADFAGIASDGFSAAAVFDADGIIAASGRMDEVTAKLNKLTPKMMAAVQAYNEAAAKCRAV